MFRKLKVEKGPVPLIPRGISMSATHSMDNGGRTVVGIPFGSFTANMPFSVLSLAWVIGPSTAMIIIIFVAIRPLTGRILGPNGNMAREAVIQSGRIRTSLSVVWQRRERAKRAFRRESIGVSVGAEVFLGEEEAALVVLENNPFIKQVIHEHR